MTFLRLTLTLTVFQIDMAKLFFSNPDNDSLKLKVIDQTIREDKNNVIFLASQGQKLCLIINQEVG